jgi:NhaP-type Na+/H+ or K+/H+ antiporter
MEMGVAILLAAVAIYGGVALWLGRISITAPIIFVLLGTLIGEHVLSWVVIPITPEEVRTLSEITLALLLFADASTLNIIEVRKDARLPGRLLLFGMPMTIALGAVLAYLIYPTFEPGLALLLGAILAPTDAALGLSIFNNPLVPVRIRRALNVESGLNDGIATPLVTLFIALSIGESFQTQSFWMAAAVTEIAIAVGVGALMGIAGGWLYSLSARKDWSSNLSQQIGNLALALCIFFSSLALGGNGFIAAFVGGILFGYITRHHLHQITEYSEVSGTLLSFGVWLIFGSTLVVPLLQDFSLPAFIYALLSLTVIRMLPVAIALTGRKLRWDTKLIMGWFGPRGLASVVFLLMAVETAREVGLDWSGSMLMSMASWTILLSVILHGVTALPLAAWYSRRIKNAPVDAPELDVVDELKPRRGRHINAEGILLKQS